MCAHSVVSGRPIAIRWNCLAAMFLVRTSSQKMQLRTRLTREIPPGPLPLRAIGGAPIVTRGGACAPRKGEGESPAAISRGEVHGTGWLISAFRDLVTEHPLFHPADGQQVVERSEQAVPHSIMALAGEARIVADGNFGHGEAFDLEQCRQEAMHAFEEFEARDALALKSAVSAPGIADLLTRQFVPDPVGDARGADADEAVAFAARVDARAANAIELFQGIEESRQVSWVILQIGVERDEVLPARSLQAGPTCGRLAAVESKTLHPDARVACRKFFEDLPGVVLAAIIGNNDFVSQVEPVHGLADRRDERAQISFFIVTRDDEAEVWGGHGSMLRLNSQRGKAGIEGAKRGTA